MKVLVPVKRVTDPDMKIKVLPDGSGIELSRMVFKVNPFDEIAIEEALRIKEKKGGEVVVVSVGGEEAQVEIRVGLSLGADRGILVTPEGVLDSDTVARVFAAVVKQEKPDLVLMGKQAVDTDDNQVAQLVSEYLGWGQACFASRIEINDNIAKVHREVDGGIEVLEIDLPGIISADLRLNEPRYPKLPDIFKAKKKQIKKIAASELGIDMSPKVVVTKFEQPPRRQAGRFVQGVAELVKVLKEEAKVI